MITYRQTKTLAPDDLEKLFLSVNWESGRHKDKLSQALANYGYVLTAWDQDRLVGLIGAMDDGIMTAYVHYLCVDPAYQKHGIGQTLIRQLKDHYQDYLKICLCAVNTYVSFYEQQGFVIDQTETAMAISRFE